jgi:hypothetical protein
MIRTIQECQPSIVRPDSRAPVVKEFHCEVLAHIREKQVYA